MDFVIAWVDGADAKWQSEKNAYLPDNTQDAGVARYRDWDFLRYWFRAVYEYAPWVDKIHFVTWGHIPAWLNTAYSKIHIVNHKDFIPDEFLPTFNSHTIELNLHRIKELSEEFVYFNDDMFLTDYVTPEYFFQNGKPCDELILDSIYFAPDSAGAYNGNDLEIINKYFSLNNIKKIHPLLFYSPLYGIKGMVKNIIFSRHEWYPGFSYNHLATSILKSTMEELWAREPVVLHDTCKDKFRSKRNVNQWLIKYWQLASGNFVPRNPKLGRVFHLKKDINTAIGDAIIKREYNMICINDTVKTENFTKHKNMINKAFQQALPGKSPFELTF